MLAFLLDEVLAQLFEWPGARSRIQRQMDEAQAAFPWEADAPKSVAKLPLETARRYQQAEADRRKALDDKGRGNLLAITLAFSILFTGLTFLTSQNTIAALGPVWRTLSLGLAVAGILFLLLGGVFALTTLEIRQIFDLTPENEAEETDAELVERLFWCVRQNQRATFQRVNALDISFKCIRNGVFVFAGLSILLAFRLWGAMGSTSETSQTHMRSSPGSTPPQPADSTTSRSSPPTSPHQP